MKTKILKISTGIIILVVCITLYKLPIITSWRNYNNGIRAFSEKSYIRAAEEFHEGMTISDDPVLKIPSTVYSI